MPRWRLGRTSSEFDLRNFEVTSNSKSAETAAILTDTIRSRELGFEVPLSRFRRVGALEARPSVSSPLGPLAGGLIDLVARFGLAIRIDLDFEIEF